MNHSVDSSSDDVPYLPTKQYQIYENQQNLHRHQPHNSSIGPESDSGNRQGRSYFTEEELRELDSSSSSMNGDATLPNISSIPRPISEHEIARNSDKEFNGNGRSNLEIYNQSNNFHRQNQIPDAVASGDTEQSSPLQQQYKISWGRRSLGLLLIGIPAILFSVAVHFVDGSMSDFQLFSTNFFIFQGIFWPFFGLFLADLFCTPKKHRSKDRRATSVRKIISKDSVAHDESASVKKWILAVCIFVHSNLSAAVLILQVLSIQRLDISISLALSFGFDVIVILIKYILEKRRCSWELVLLSIVSYSGYAITAIPAFIDSDGEGKTIAAGVGASIGVMLLSIPSSFLLAHLRQYQVRESVLGTSFAFFGCIQTLITKEIMGETFNLYLDGHSVGWVAGLICVVFLGTIFLHLEERLSGLIWDRDNDDKPKHFSSITRTRLAVFILSCLWELARQGFTYGSPVAYDILGGSLVILSFLLSGGYQAWDKTNQFDLDETEGRSSSSEQRQPKFCAFIPWLFSQKHYTMR